MTYVDDSLNQSLIAFIKALGEEPEYPRPRLSSFARITSKQQPQFNPAANEFTPRMGIAPPEKKAKPGRDSNKYDFDRKAPGKGAHWEYVNPESSGNAWRKQKPAIMPACTQPAVPTPITPVHTLASPIDVYPMAVVGYNNLITKTCIDYKILLRDGREIHVHSSMLDNLARGPIGRDVVAKFRPDVVIGVIRHMYGASISAEALYTIESIAEYICVHCELGMTADITHLVGDHNVLKLLKQCMVKKYYNAGARVFDHTATVMGGKRAGVYNQLLTFCRISSNWTVLAGRSYENIATQKLVKDIAAALFQ
jgi:hypothetical protein